MRTSSLLPRGLGYLERHAFTISLALIAVAVVRVVSTYPVFSHTFDEPAHIAAGMEWLDQRAYSLEHQHPPLARVMTALLPYLVGERSGHHRDIVEAGTEILYRRDHYGRVLALARMGTLPFLCLAALIVYAWSRRYFGAAVSVVAVFLFTQLPAILAHAGLATTDMAATALVGATAYALLVWSEEPTVQRTLVAGGCLGLAVLSKFSSLVFVPAALVVMCGWYLVTERPSFHSLLSLARSRLALLPLGLVAASIVIWAGYRFSFGPVHFAPVRIPAPELYSGIAAVLEHNRIGHFSYLLGQRSQSGWWYFFPVALTVKMPLAFLLLALGGVVVSVWRKTPARWPLAYVAALLSCAMLSRINIGTRHILPIYIGLAILGAIFAVACVRQWRANRTLAGAGIALLVWFTVSVGFNHPDYIAYFNVLAGPEPERVLVDSDLDWGQDLKRLATRLREIGAREVAGLPPALKGREVLRMHLAKMGFPPVRDFDPLKPSPGWNAVSVTMLKLRLGLGDARSQPVWWPEVIAPTERVGKSILLYYVPPPPVP